MSKSTRYYDLGMLEEARDQGRDVGDILEKAYKDTKDDYLEKIRKAKIEAIKKNDHKQIEYFEKLLEKYKKGGD